MIIILLASVFLIQAVVEAFNSQGSPSIPKPTTAKTVAATTGRPTVIRIGAFSQGSHRKRSGQDREPDYVNDQHNGKGNINMIYIGYAKARAEEDLQRDKHSIRPLEPLTRDLQIQPENEQSLQSLEKVYSVPLVFSLWLGTKNTDDEQHTAISSYNIAGLENVTNPIHTSVVQSLWQLLCTRPDIQLLGDVEDNFVSPQEAMETDACINFLNRNRRRFQQLRTPQLEEEAEAVSILRQTPIVVKVERRQVENTVWTEWTTVFQVERIGDRYIHLALQESNAALSSSAVDLDSLTTLAAVEIMRESLQLLLDIAVLAGPMNQVLQERLTTNSLSGNDKSSASSMATEASQYTTLSSPKGGELKAFPAGIPNVFSSGDKDNKSNETAAGIIPPSPPSVITSRRQPNTFDASILNAPRIVGISLLILTLVGYATILHLSRKQRKHLEGENGAISATEDTRSYA